MRDEINQVGTFENSERFALELDRNDPLARFRERFHIPVGADGRPVTYFCGNSLGLQPKTTREFVLEELDDWARMGVEGHFAKEHSWADYDRAVEPRMAELVGASASEVAVMNGLTVNLHLLMVSFYRPTATRYKILMETRAFPSDQYAAKSQARFHGFNPDEAILELMPRDGEDVIRTEDILDLIEKHGDEIAIVLLGAVNYATGQLFDVETITRAARARGCVVCVDAAHAVGNVPLQFHDWGVDCAVWCNYKYVNAGPGAVGGAFVHERHARAFDLPRFVGWWGNRGDTRFQMKPDYELEPGAAGWQLSNLPILSMAALRASLDIFHEAGIENLRRKSETMTAYLYFLLDGIGSDRFEIVTPHDPAARGCQLSLRVASGAREAFAAMQARGVIGDFREPNIIRVAPVPLYNTFEEVRRFAGIWAEVFSIED